MLTQSRHISPSLSFFFFNDTATTEIYTLSLHDALPISDAWPALARRDAHPRGNDRRGQIGIWARPRDGAAAGRGRLPARDRKRTRLNSSHMSISYAVFCLKKKKNK